MKHSSFQPSLRIKSAWTFLMFVISFCSANAQNESLARLLPSKAELPEEKEVIMPDSFKKCEVLKPILAHAFAPVSDFRPGVYMANFCFTVPKGYKGCGDKDKMFVQANNPRVNMLIKSHSINTTVSSFTDEICVALQILTPANHDYSSILVYITLCDEEHVQICRILNIQLKICDYYFPMTGVAAICNDPNLKDSLRVYSGSINMPLWVGNSTYEGLLSTEMGFVSDSISVVKNTIHIHYKASTTNASLAECPVLMKFIVDVNQICFPLMISLPSCNGSSPRSDRSEEISYFMPLTGGSEDRAKSPVEKPIQAYQVMPNPTSDRVNVTIKDYTPEKRYDLRLVNAMGQVVKTERLISDLTEIDLKTRPPGVYQVSITANGVLVYVDKLVLLR